MTTTKVFNQSGAITRYANATKSDSVDLPVLALGVMLRTASSVSLVQPDGTVVAWASGELLVGVQYSLPHVRMNDTGTSGSDLIQLF